MIKIFDPERLSKSPAAFDAKKLEWVNNQYMKQMDLDELTAMCVPYGKSRSHRRNIDRRKSCLVEKIVSLYQPQMSFAAQIVDLSELFFEEHPELDDAAKEVLAGETVPTVLTAFKEKLQAMPVVEAAAVKAAIKEIQKKQASKARIYSCRSASVSGQTHGPELPDTVELLGKEKALDHLNNVL